MVRTFKYNIAGHLCEINFYDSYNDESLIPSFAPFVSTEQKPLLFRMEVDDKFRWDFQGDEVG
ncbi:MAG: hypothetical protein IKA86_01645, partial [Paraprevotella sp.]|nr:hypothetical protein [Paraprevotella sp.]